MSGAGAEEGRALRRDAEANRQKILVAAAQLFAERGLDVGHDQIARTAGVAVGTVYRRFPDKSALIAALYSEQVEQVVAAARAALLIEDPWEAIVEFLTAVLGMQAHSRGLRDLSAGHPHGQELADHTRRNVAPVVVELVARGHAAGVLRPEIVEQDLAMVPVMVGAVIQAARGVDPELWRRCLAVVLAGMHVGDPAPIPGAAPSPQTVRRILDGPRAPDADDIR